MYINISEPGDISLRCSKPRFNGAGSFSIKTPQSEGAPPPPPPPPPPGEFLGDGTYTVLTGPTTCGSFFIDGSTSGNTLNTVASSQLNFGTGSFTIEWWQYQSGENNPFVRPFSFGSHPDATFAASYESSNLYGWFPGLEQFGSITPYKNQWVHFAITRLNGVIKLFKNGQQLGSNIANTSNIVHSTGLTVGGEETPTINTQFGGYITNFHIMKASKYLTNFTPDTSKPIPPTSQTVFLLDCDDAGNVSKDYVGLIATSAYGNTWNSINPFGF
jgi:hypothetical protein